MLDRENVKKGIWQCWLPSTEEEYATQCHDCPYYEPGITLEECMTALRTDALALLKEQDELLKHEYWRGYNNGRADERGLQEGTIMQTFSPD